MNTQRALASGAIATGVMTALWLVEPSVGLPNIAVGQMLSTAMSVSVGHFAVGAAGGWLIHLLVGVLWALLYAWQLDARLPGSPAVRGAIFGAGLFVVAQLLFTPFVGSGLFSHGDVELLAGSLLGHLVYGTVLGWTYAPAGAAAVL